MNLKKIIRTGESETVEFKESFNDAVIETLSAFANASGGTVFKTTQMTTQKDTQKTTQKAI
ncbi:MAG: hypothetical protein AUK23_05825 [Deltaproteobacteria bacterium CG2_30_43_15]|nr:MAG: hypothetical protein AUK23_05825 [Deltaproteobacteria bacterium CG2_30_43_15]